jgi:hypothetical protein
MSYRRCDEVSSASCALVSKTAIVPLQSRVARGAGFGKAILDVYLCRSVRSGGMRDIRDSRSRDRSSGAGCHDARADTIRITGSADGSSNAGLRDARARNRDPDRQTGRRCLHRGAIPRLTERDGLGSGLDRAEQLLHDRRHIQERSELSARSRPQDRGRRRRCQLELDGRREHHLRNLADRRDLRRRTRTRDLRRPVEGRAEELGISLITRSGDP